VLLYGDLPVMRAVRFEGRKEEKSSVTCSAVEFEPKPLGPAMPAKYRSVAFMDCPALDSHKLDSHKDKAFVCATKTHIPIYMLTHT